MATQLEYCEIRPPPGGKVADLMLPLTFSDIKLLCSPPAQCLMFYESPNCSKDYFLETIVPKLKASLSLTLKHYFPLAGNLLYHLSRNEKPVFRYLVGDSVSLVIAESDVNFDIMTTKNYVVNAHLVSLLVRQLPPPKQGSEYKACPVLSLQVTLFPTRGLSIGVTSHHGIGDASSIVGFINAWASINKDPMAMEVKSSLPIFDRSLVKDPFELGDLFWNHLNKYFADLQTSPAPSLQYLPTNMVRATIILRQVDIQKLKDSYISAQRIKSEVVVINYISSFVVATAYVWTCMVKSGPASGEKVDGDEEEYLSLRIDMRARMNPPIPANYFGNCIVGAIVKLKHHQAGFFTAAEAIAEMIQKKANITDEILKEYEEWPARWGQVVGKRALAISGSPKFDMYKADYGWGRPKKADIASIDGSGWLIGFSLAKASGPEGGLEIGLCLPKRKMDAFAAIFASGLGILPPQQLPNFGTSALL